MATLVSRVPQVRPMAGNQPSGYAPLGLHIAVVTRRPFGPCRVATLAGEAVRFLMSTSAVTDRSTRPPRHSRVCSSTMDTILIVRPSVVASNWKSTAHTCWARRPSPTPRTVLQVCTKRERHRSLTGSRRSTRLCRARECQERLSNSRTSLSARSGGRWLSWNCDSSTAGSETPGPDSESRHRGSSRALRRRMTQRCRAFLGDAAQRS